MKQSLFAPLIAPVTALFVAASATGVMAADIIPLSSISSYLNGLKTAQSPFSQTNDDGSTSSGNFYMHRPGRMRFQYAPPDSAVVTAGGGAVTIHDSKSNQPPETYPLRRTPLSIILAKRVDLGRAKMVVGHEFDGTSTIVTAQDPENPDYGYIQLVFSDDPVALRKWVINDGSGGQTTVELGDLQTGMKLSSLLFTTQAGAAPTMGDR